MMPGVVKIRLASASMENKLLYKMVVRQQQVSIPRKEKQPHVFNVTNKQTNKR